MENITVIIKTFERPRSLFRLLKSLRKHYPRIPIVIADDSRVSSEADVRKAFPDLRMEFHTMPFDSGASAGRNLCLRQVRTPYFLLCDDDFVFDRRADLELAQDLLEQHDLDLLGGLYYDVFPLSAREALKDLLSFRFFRLRNQLSMQGVARRFFGNLVTQADGSVKLEQIPYTDPLVRCDLVQNFFLARTQRVRDTVGGWDDKLKIGGEHEAFFYKAKGTGLRVGNSERFGIVHYQETNKTYQGFRDRARDIRPKEFRDWFK